MTVTDMFKIYIQYTPVYVFSFMFQEQQYSIEEMRRQKTTFASRISDREGEIERLRNQVYVCVGEGG